MAGYVTGAAVVGGELILSLSDGQIIRAGYIQGARGEKGEPGPVGPQGLPGTDGNGMLHGVGFPRADIGRDNDFYYDTKNVAMFGPKVGGAWGSPVYLKPQGDVVRNGQRYDSKTLQDGARFFGSGQIPSGPPTFGLQRIIGHSKPLPAASTQPPNNPHVVAWDDEGDVFHAIIHAQCADGSWYGEVVCTRDGNGDTTHVVAWETPSGNTPPNLVFTTEVDPGTNRLVLAMTTDIDISQLRGKIIYI